jgi:hypothetical protein
MKQGLQIIVAQAYNPSTQEAEAGGYEFPANLGYKARPVFK